MAVSSIYREASMTMATALRLQRWFVFVMTCLVATSASSADPLSDLLTGKTEKADGATERVISSANTHADDTRIARRLQGIFSEVDDLQGIAVSVNDGVVELRGEVDARTTEQKALQFARQIEGVVEVQNDLTINRDLGRRLTSTWDKLIASGERLIATLPLLLIALAVLVFFWLAGRWVAARHRIFRRITPNFFIAKLLGQLVQLVSIIIGLVLALVLLDATALIGTILGAAGIIGLAVGFAVRDTVENYIASILLSIRNPFEVNDTVDIEGHVGNVVKLTSRATILLSPDGNDIRIPNARVFKAVIINLTRRPERRFDFDVGVDPGQDLAAAQTLALQTFASITGVLDDPKPLAIVQTLGDSNVILRCYGWVDQQHFSFPKVRSEAIRLVKQAFDQAGIGMPEPVYQVRLSNTDASEINAPTPSAPQPTPVPGTGTPATGDVSVDRTIEQKVAEQDPAEGADNLLSPDQESEL